MRNIKMSLALVLMCLIVIFAIQNAEALEVDFLVWTFTLRRAVMLFAVLAIGIIIGWTWRSLSKPGTARRSDREPPRDADG